MAVALSNSLISATDFQLQSISGCFLKPSQQQCLLNVGSRNLFLHPIHGRILDDTTTCKRGLSVRAGFSESGRTSSTSIFIGGFILGGIIVGTLGCVYAPQPSLVPMEF